jgi:hypothetical protein
MRTLGAPKRRLCLTHHDDEQKPSETAAKSIRFPSLIRGNADESESDVQESSLSGTVSGAGFVKRRLAN